MKLDLSDELNTFHRIQASNGRSSYSQTENTKAKPAEFGDREIQMYMLNPQTPSADLKSLYDAIRYQMIRDGCA